MLPALTVSLDSHCRKPQANMSADDTTQTAKLPRIEKTDNTAPADGGYEAWLTARKALLEEEKKFSKARARLAEMRRKLPAYVVPKDYTFEAAGTGELVPFADIFGTNDTLIVQHVMLDDSWENACTFCSFFADGFNASLKHLLPRASMCIITAAGPKKLQEVREKKNWPMPAFSSRNNSFNYDFKVSFTAEQLADGGGDYNFGRKWKYGNHAFGLSVFQKRDGKIYHTYSTFGPGLAEFQTVFSLLDITPQGRNEKEGGGNMFWVKHMEEY